MPQGRHDVDAEGLVLQRLRFGHEVSLRPLYLRPLNRAARQPEACREEGGLLALAGGAAISFDTYFGACFEIQWRGATRIASLMLGIDATGSFALRLLRRSAQGETALLHDELFRDADGRFSVPVWRRRCRRRSRSPFARLLAPRPGVRKGGTAHARHESHCGARAP